MLQFMRSQIIRHESDMNQTEIRTTTIEIGQVLLFCIFKDEKTEAQKDKDHIQSKWWKRDLNPGLSRYVVWLTLYPKDNICASLEE